MNTTQTKLLLPALLAALAAACGDSTATPGAPSKPAVGVQIERMGRPAINTALTNPFEAVAGKTSDQSKDEYNQNSNVNSWGTAFKPEIAINLAILDGLDRTCGNQLAAKAATAGTVPADRYAALAGVLADDQLYVRTDKSTCGLYLAVEADYTGLTTNNGDCGGRTPLEDVIDESYSLLAIGAPSGVKDNVDAAADGTASLTAFPFLAAPH